MQAVSSPQRRVSPSRDVLKYLHKAARRSTHNRHQTGCVIAGGNGAIISTGCSHSSSFRLNELHSIHAEIHASWNAKVYDFNNPSEDWQRNAVAYILTLARKSGNVTYSAPCLTCAIALKTRGINRVVYSVSEGVWEEINLSEEIPWNLKVYPTRRKK